VVSPEIGPDNPGPMFFAGFRFDPERKPDQRVWRGFPHGYLLLPRVTLLQRDGRSFLTYNFQATPNREPEMLCELTVQFRSRIHDCLVRDARLASTDVVTEPDDETLRHEDAYRTAVASAAQSIRDGAFEKVVMARRREIRTNNFYNIPRAIERLRTDYPGCYTFAVARHGAVFVGSSPEQLVKLEGKDVSTVCLAGSIGRGDTPEADAALGQRLLDSPKDRHEHEVCVRAIREALEPLCDRLEIPDSPELMTVSNVHHLHTPVRGHLNNGSTIFQLVERLHPTPAVGGYPKEAARQFIRENEGMDRGWYASPIGWVDSNGNGEFAVALRSALIRGLKGHLFAGCGIMGESEPEKELAESELKLRPMLSAMGE
jgi:isochorismate synthase